MLQQGPTNDLASTPKFLIKDQTGATKTVFTADGKLGIGTVSPASGLHVGGTAVSTGNNDGIGALVDTTIKAAKHNDSLYGLKLAPSVDANGFAAPLLYSLYLPGVYNGIVRMRFDNTSNGTSAQAGIEMNNDVGQSLMTFYSSTSSVSSLRNLFYVKNAIGPIKFLAAPGGSVGFGVGSTAGSATSLFIDSSNNVGVGNAAPVQKLDVAGGIRVGSSGTQPACTDTIRGTFWFVNGGSGNDTMQVCAKVDGVNLWKPLW